jgi:hypothetical protein
VSGEVDLDRLADYVGGALDGTPDEAVVAQLVATDPRWTRAHAALVAADAFVRTDLATLAADPARMPDDVAARLTAALAAEPAPPAPATVDHGPQLSVLPGDRLAHVPSPARRWRSVAAVAAAAILLALGAASLAPQLRGSGAKSSGVAASADRAATPYRGEASGTASAGTFDAAPLDVRASGSDYTAGTLAALGGALTADATGKSARDEAAEASTAPPSGPTGIPDPLRRLTEPGARAVCLNAVVARYGGTVRLLDYARYQGSPALIVLLDGAGGVVGRKWVVAVGPTCGAGGAIADQRYSGPVG